MKTLPNLKRTVVTIKYSTDDGISRDETIPNDKSNPSKAMISGLEELARLTALFGLEDEAEKVFMAARQRVKDWKQHNGYT